MPKQVPPIAPIKQMTIISTITGIPPTAIVPMLFVPATTALPVLSIALTTALAVLTEALTVFCATCFALFVFSTDFVVVVENDLPFQ